MGVFKGVLSINLYLCICYLTVIDFFMVDMNTERGRIDELDYLKCVFIVLMIVFHLAYFGDMYPVAKKFVYTFHMPAFLLLSGYLANTSKPLRCFGSYLLWLVVPYAVMEAGYTVMASLLPIREHIDNLTLAVFVDKLVLHPIGPYWFIHTLILLETLCYAIMRFARPSAEAILIFAFACWLLSTDGVGLISFSNAIYFIAGAAVRRSGLNILSVFASRTPLTALPLVLLCFDSSNFDRASFAGMAITWLVISFLLFVCRYIKPGRIVLYIGRHTLVILLFSPIFTFFAKALIPVFAFDPTAFLFMFVSVVFVLCGCFALARLLDIVGVSRWLLGKDNTV